MAQLWSALFTMVCGCFLAAFWFWGANFCLDRILPTSGPDQVRNARNAGRAAHVRPWLFMGPAVLMLALYLVWPVLCSVWLSVHDAAGQSYVGLSNWRWLAHDQGFRDAMFNNLLWLLVVPAISTFLGLVAAALTDRIRWGNLAKSLIFMPMAISFAGAAVIWKFVYEYRPEGDRQIGLLNAVVTAFGAEPQAWIAVPFWNNFLLMAILVWIQTGFAMVILSATLRAIPEEMIEAAVLDGANGIRIFFQIQVPQIWGTIAVVWTTITITVLKVFDIVLAMTNGQWKSNVLANLMFDWMFRGGGDFGRGAAIALVIMLLVTPIMVWNIRVTRNETRGH